MRGTGCKSSEKGGGKVPCRAPGLTQQLSPWAVPGTHVQCTPQASVAWVTITSKGSQNQPKLPLPGGVPELCEASDAHEHTQQIPGLCSPKSLGPGTAEELCFARQDADSPWPWLEDVSVARRTSPIHSFCSTPDSAYPQVTGTGCSQLPWD